MKLIRVFQLLGVISLFHTFSIYSVGLNQGAGSSLVDNHTHQVSSWDEIEAWIDPRIDVMSEEFPGGEDIQTIFIDILKIRLKVVFAVLEKIVPGMSEEIFVICDGHATLSLNEILFRFSLNSRMFILNHVAGLISQRYNLEYIDIFLNEGLIVWRIITETEA